MSKNNIKIVHAKKKHCTYMKKINEQCLPENYELLYWEYTVSFHNSFVLCNNNVPVGYCLVGEKDKKNALVSSFAILNDYRKKGYGRKLLNNSLKHLEEKKYENVYLQVRCSNSIAIQLYTSLGFKINNVLYSYYQDKEDAYEMKKQLR